MVRVNLFWLNYIDIVDEKEEIRLHPMLNPSQNPNLSVRKDSNDTTHPLFEIIKQKKSFEESGQFLMTRKKTTLKRTDSSDSYTVNNSGLKSSRRDIFSQRPSNILLFDS